MKNLLPRHRAARAFTLVELLVVIAIVALLAAMVAYLLPTIAGKKIRARVIAEMHALDIVINQYKSKTGFYPPDNGTTNVFQPLYYEIKAIDPSQAETNELRIAGIANAGDVRQDFFPSMKPSATNSVTLNGTPVWFFVVPAKGPGGTTPNPWRYNSHAPEHNLESYDLWAEVEINGETVIIGNWKK
jgi:prepilin-type N-terminal cleavage/methylation domain-containing protein